MNPRSGTGSPTADELAAAAQAAGVQTHVGHRRGDGSLETPVEFRIEPRALRVLVPPA